MPNHKSLIILIMLLAGLASLSAWSITDNYFGNRTGAWDARSYAMGGTGLYDDLRPFGISTNPANLTLMNKRVGLQGGLILNRNEDTRAVPLYNSFDNYIDDAVYASNINFYDDYAGAGFGTLKLGRFRMGLGLYHQPVLNFEGNYFEQIRNNRNTDNDGYPEMIAINTIENSGHLNQASAVVSLGFALGDVADLNLGFDYGLLYGSTQSVKSIRWSQWAINTVGAGVLPEYTAMEAADLEGYRLKAGFTVRLNQNFGIASTVSPKAVLQRTGSMSEQRDAYLHTVAIDTTTPINEDYVLPAEAKLGLHYQPRNIMRTWFNLEAEYVKFSDVGTQFADAVNLYAGVEHHVQNRLPLRLGFQATNGYLRIVESDGAIIAKPILTPMLTAGSSVQVSKSVSLDLGFGYTWRSYEALDLFGDAYYNDKTYTGSSTYQLWPNQYIALSNRGWENPDKVNESNISLSTSLSFTW